jgi:hypothetical protein
MGLLCIFRSTFWPLYIFSPSPGHFLCYYHQQSWLLGGHYAKKYALGLLVVLRLCNSIDIVMCFLEVGNCVNTSCFLWNDCVCYSLQMEKSMVEVAISLVVLCGGNRDGSLLYLWVLLEGFTLFSPVGCFLIVMVTTPGCIWCYGVVVYVLNHLLVTTYCFHLVVGSFCIIGIHTVGYGVAIIQRSML